MDFQTRVLHTGVEVDKATGAASVPIYQTSTFDQRSLDAHPPYDYTRSGNPTRAALETVLAELEGGGRGFAFATGMAAISTVLMLLSAGDHLIVTDDCYGGTYRALTRVFNRFGLTVSFVDTRDPANIAAAIGPNTRAVLLETLSNPFLHVTDIAACAEVAHAHNLLVLVDNTFLSPALCRPLALGADIVIHSATKYLGGHSDVMAGAAIVRPGAVHPATGEDLGQALYFLQNALGTGLAPQDCWLVMRGIKTLHVRMKEQQATAQALAQWLTQQPQVAEVYYPGLPDHPGHATLRRQAAGPGAMLSFRLQSEAMTRPFLAALQLPILGVSLGAVETIIAVPAHHSHASVPADVRARRGITDALIRLSVGIESLADLQADLARGLAAAGKII
jgi:cystathionine beta-lyase